MTITVSTTDPRSIKALAVLETADRWHRGHTKAGRSFYAVPSSTDPNGFHMVDCRECTCQDFIRRGLDCKHILAVRLHLARLQAEQPKRRASKPAASFTRDASIGGTISAPERARLAALATDVWGHDGDGS